MSVAGTCIRGAGGVGSAGASVTRVALAIAAAAMSVVLHAAPEPLRVCSDPNNLPFSNKAGEGFENRIAEAIARDHGTTVQYTWWAERRGFLRNTLNAGTCDVVMGYPSHADPVATTRPYYRSTYVFVTRRSEHLHVRSLDDPILRKVRVGVQLMGNDGANSPPAHALSNRGIVSNVVGYTVYGDYRQPNPASSIVSAVARGDVDVAAVWGPLAGFFAARQRVRLDLVPVTPRVDGALPQAFAISMAVRKRDAQRLRVLDTYIQSHQRDIDRILDEYHVPRVEE